MNREIRFKKVREGALEYWKVGSKRKRRKFYDDVLGTFECKWQNKVEQYHVSIFCSLAEWANNITDILSEKSYDDLRFGNKKERVVLFRYYTRFLLVASEMLTDFQDIYVRGHSNYNQKNKNETEKQFHKRLKTESRAVLSENTIEIQELFSFINKVCKHKANRGYHYNNHHNDYVFGDFDKQQLGNELISLKSIEFKKDIKILVPELKHILSVIIQSYKKTDSIFAMRSKVFETICESYKE